MAAPLLKTKTLGAPTRARGATSSHCLGRSALLCVRMGSLSEHFFAAPAGAAGQALRLRRRFWTIGRYPGQRARSLSIIPPISTRSPPGAFLQIGVMSGHGTSR